MRVGYRKPRAVEMNNDMIMDDTQHSNLVMMF